jgi:hypothetical protein
MENGQIAYFYYDNIIPCQKCRIKEVITGGYEVNWLNNNNKSTGTSSVPSDRIFSTQKECMTYSNSIEYGKENRIRERLNSKDDVLRFMYDSIWSEDYDYSTEKKILRDKIREYFGVIIEE